MAALPEKGSNISVEIIGVGYSASAISLLVGKMTVVDSGEEVRGFQKAGVPMHVTVALGGRTSAVDSYKAITEGQYAQYPEAAVFQGSVKHYN